MLYYADHAKDRMRERGIPKQEVVDCLEQYQVSYPSESDDDCMNYVYTSPTGRKIRVVVNEKILKHRVIISVMEERRQNED